MGKTNSLPPLEKIVDRVVTDHTVRDVYVRSETIQQINGQYSFTLVWNFEEAIPDFQYKNGSEEVAVEEKTAQVKFQSGLRKDRLEQPHIRLTKSPAKSPKIDILSTALSEVVMPLERFNKVIQAEGEGYRVEYVSVSAFESEIEGDNLGSQYEDDSVGGGPLYIRVSYGSAHHHEDKDGMLTNCRFNHVSYLSIEEETIPVRIKTTLFPEEGTPRESTERVISGGIWVHTSEFLVEHTPAKKLELDEEINKRDLSSLLHEARPSTYPPVN